MNARRGEPWFDEDAGPLVRPFAVTKGRTRTRYRTDLDMISLIVAAHDGVRLRLEPEKAELVRLAQVPLSVAELSANLRLPLAVTKVLIGDLIDEGYLISRSPSPSRGSRGRPDVRMMQKVLDGLRKL